MAPELACGLFKYVSNFNLSRDFYQAKDEDRTEDCEATDELISLLTAMGGTRAVKTVAGSFLDALEGAGKSLFSKFT